MPATTNAFTKPISFDLFGNGLWTPLQSGDGSEDGQILIPNITSFGMQPSSAQESISGTQLKNEGNTLDVVTRGGDFSVQVQSNRFTANSLSLAMSGTHAEQSAGTLVATDEVVDLLSGVGHLANFAVQSATVAIRGLNLTVDDSTGFAANTKLTNQTTGKAIGVVAAVPDGTHIHAFLTDVVPVDADVVTDGTNTATIAGSGVADINTLATLTTDFTVDETDGEITIVAAGALDISNLTKVKINYSYTQFSGSIIQLNAATLTKGQLIIKAKNLVDGGRVHITLFELSLSADSLLTLLTGGGGDRSTVSWTATAATPTGKSVPGQIIVEQL